MDLIKRNIAILFVILLITGAMLATGPNVVYAQADSWADQPVIMLWPEGAPGAKGTTPKDQPSITVFEPASEANGTAVLICPGGGYAMEAMEKEGYKVAEWLNSLGITAFVLKYRHGDRYQYPAPMQDAKRAMKLIRSRAQKWNINPDKVGILGFSAGGHLASTVGTHWKHQVVPDRFAEFDVSPRPDFMILIYPVITMKDAFTHQGSKTMLLGKQPDRELVKLLSNEEQVTAQTPPTFLVQGTNDQAVPVENSVAFYRALHEHGVPVEMHLFEEGPHGFGLAQDDAELSAWLLLCKNWMRSRGLLPNL